MCLSYIVYNVLCTYNTILRFICKFDLEYGLNSQTNHIRKSKKILKSTKAEKSI